MKYGATTKSSKIFRCFPHKGLKLSLHRLRSKSSSPQSPQSPITPKKTTREDELREVFRRVDSDSDGKISAMELRSYFASVGEYMSHEEAQGAIDDVDTDGHKLIDFGDFVRLMTREGDEEDEDIKAAFGMFELEKGSGLITPKSLQRELSRLGDVKSQEECEAMIRVFDTDGNGEIDFNEFHQMMA